MEVSPGDVPLPNPSRALKRSASTASLPTPPRTHRRHKRGRSRGDCDSDSDKEEEIGGSALSSSGEEDDELPRLDQRTRKKRRLCHSKGEDGDEEAFWLAGPDPEAELGEGRGDQGMTYLSDTDKEDVAPGPASSSSAPLLYRKSLKRTQSQGSVGLASPPPSHRKSQPQAPITPPAGVSGPSTSAVLLKTQPASPPKTPRKQTWKGLKSPDIPVISDSPNNPFYVVPGSPSPGEESESPRVDSVSPRTPGAAHLERPTVTYVFRGVRREYANPLYNHRENRPLSPAPTSLLPIEHPDYSPDMGCKPTVLFPNARKGKRPATAAKGEVAGGAGTSNGLRRSPRRKKAVIGDSDDENEPESRHRAVEDDDELTAVKPRKLNFGLAKSSTSTKATKAKAKAGGGDPDLF